MENRLELAVPDDIDEKEPRFSLPVFEGPLDLLLYLIDKNELDIYDIPISVITRQYNVYLSRMKELNLYIAADFVIMAATLMHIKSYMLLPKPPQELIAEQVDPREALVQQLLERKKFLEASQVLGDREVLSVNRFYRTKHAEDEGALSTYDTEVWDLVEAIKDIFRRAEDRGRKIILIEEKNIAVKMEEIMSLLKERPTAVFTELLGSRRDKPEIVITFLALLELAKKRLLLLIQDAPFDMIRVVRKGAAQP